MRCFGPRSRIHASACHVYSRSATTDAVPPDCSVANANGSAFSMPTPAPVSMWNLYRAPVVHGSNVPDHTPLEATGASAWTPGVHPFASPMTDTARAFGAQTENSK